MTADARDRGPAHVFECPFNDFSISDENPK
jgi:hypothetical protein